MTNTTRNQFSLRASLNATYQVLHISETKKKKNSKEDILHIECPHHQHRQYNVPINIAALTGFNTKILCYGNKNLSKWMSCACCVVYIFTSITVLYYKIFGVFICYDRHRTYMLIRKSTMKSATMGKQVSQPIYDI